MYPTRYFVKASTVNNHIIDSVNININFTTNTEIDII